MEKIHISWKVVIIVFFAFSCKQENAIRINYYEYEGVENIVIADTVGSNRPNNTRINRIINLIHTIEQNFAQGDTVVIDENYTSFRSANLTDSIKSYIVEYKDDRFSYDCQIFSYNNLILYFKNSESHDVYRLVKVEDCIRNGCTVTSFKVYQEIIDSKLVIPIPDSIFLKEEVIDSVVIDFNN